jgi:hypothetical protein
MSRTTPGLVLSLFPGIGMKDLPRWGMNPE